MNGPAVCLTSDWEPDRSFLERLERKLQERGHTTYLVWPGNLDDTVAAVRRGELEFSYFLDRASNTSPEFFALTGMLQDAGVPCLDTPQAMVWAADKATMHLEFHRAGIEVPYTVILDSFENRADLPGLEAELSALGSPFVIKPANTTGGGIGVFDRAATREDIQQVRQQYPRDKYLLQAKMSPKESEGRRNWFRTFYAGGRIFPSWWDDRSHLYAPVSEGEVERCSLEPLWTITESIARVCRLNLFSSEIVKTTGERFVVVDYVNETPDLRSKSTCPDGVPEHIVEEIVDVLARSIDSELAR